MGAGNFGAKRHVSRGKAACKTIVAECAKRWDGQMPGRRDDITTVVVDLTHPDTAVAPFVSAWGDGPRS